MNAICHPTPDIDEINKQALAISGFISGMLSASTSLCLVELRAIPMFFTFKKYFRLTEFSCFSENTAKCKDCLIKVESSHKNILEMLNKLYTNTGGSKLYFISNALCKKIIPILEDRLDTLQFSTDPQLVAGLSNYISHIKQASQNQPPVDWRKRIQAL